MIVAPFFPQVNQNYEVAAKYYQEVSWNKNLWGL